MRAQALFLLPIPTPLDRSPTRPLAHRRPSTEEMWGGNKSDVKSWGGFVSREYGMAVWVG